MRSARRLLLVEIPVIREEAPVTTHVLPAVTDVPLVPGEVTRRILAAYEAGDLVIMCAWCRRVQIDGRWTLAPRAALLAIDTQFTLSHSICPACDPVPPVAPSAGG